MNSHKHSALLSIGLLCAFCCPAGAQLPHAVPGGFDLANGWRITPAGKAIGTEDMVLKLITVPDGKAVIASHSGYNPHGIVVIDTRTGEPIPATIRPGNWTKRSHWTKFILNSEVQHSSSGASTQLVTKMRNV